MVIPPEVEFIRAAAYEVTISSYSRDWNLLLVVVVIGPAQTLTVPLPDVARARVAPIARSYDD
jgi:hypothetical protein